MITSVQNPLIKSIVALHRKSGRDEQGLCLVEGPKAIEEAFRAGLSCTTLLFENRWAEGHPHWVDPLLAFAQGQGELRHERVSDGVMAKLSTTQSPPGCAAVFRTPNLSLGELWESRMFQNKHHQAVFLALDGLQDPGNVGTLIRTAKALGVLGVFVTDGTSDPWSPKVIRSTTGLGFSLPVVNIHSPATLLNSPVKSPGTPKLFHYAAMCSGDGITSYRNTAYEYPAVLWIGSEGAGLDLTTFQGAEEGQAPLIPITIPMEAGVDSLNAGISGALLMAEMTFKAPSA